MWGPSSPRQKRGLFLSFGRRWARCQQGLRRDPWPDQVEVGQICFAKIQAPFRTRPLPRSRWTTKVPQLKEPLPRQACPDPVDNRDNPQPVTGCLPEVDPEGNLFTIYHVSDGYTSIDRRSSESVRG
jgi:hypothetical protein